MVVIRYHFFKTGRANTMKTTIYPYDIFNLFNPWPSELFNWWSDIYADKVTTDFVENPFDYKIELETPGMRKKDLKITIQNQILSVEGNRRKSSGKWFKKDACAVGFQRSFVLPESVDESRLQAKFTNGRLLITMPKKKNFINYRTIPVEGSSETSVHDYSTKENWLNKAGNRFKTLFRKAA